MDTILIEIILITAFILLSALFAATETALLSMSEPFLHQILEEEKRHIRLLSAWKENPNRVLSVILIGNSFSSIATSALATSVSDTFFHSIGITGRESIVLSLTIGITTFVVLLFGEIVPKTFAKNNISKMLLLFPLMYLFYIMLKWLDAVFTSLTKIIIMGLGGKIQKESPPVTEAEIESMIRLGGVSGSISKDKQELFNSVIEFSETTVKEIMVPRTDIIGIKSDAVLEDVLRKFEENKFSRYPVYNKNFDDMIGIFYAKDLINHLKKGNISDGFKIRDHVHPVFYVPETKKIKELLREFQKRHLQIAVVVDEFGGTSGIVSLEDVIEELVGEIHDEYDDFESSIKKVGDFHYIAQAKVSLSELEDVLKIKFPDDENYESLGGFILTKMGKVPEKGEQMEYENHAFTIKERDDTRIIIVDIEKKKKN